MITILRQTEPLVFMKYHNLKFPIPIGLKINLRFEQLYKYLFLYYNREAAVFSRNAH